MAKPTKIYTRTGDDGSSGLVGGARLEKNSTRFQAIGDVDEANAIIGFTSVILSNTSQALPILQRVQNDLFVVGADLATPHPGDSALPNPGDTALRLSKNTILNLEQDIDDLASLLSPLAQFVLPGGSEPSARLHMARTSVRRAERSVVALSQTHDINPTVLIYLNRLSDLLFQLARFENDTGKSDVVWNPNKE